jgi:peptide/nickel transport system permease protein
MIARYAAERFLQMIPTLLVITALVFGLILIIPGDPVMAMLGYVTDERSAVSPEVYARMRERLGLDQPLYVQYLRWLGRAVQGDLGTSVVTGQPVLNLIVSRLPATVYLATASLALALLLAIPGGLWAAVRRNTVVDHAATGFVLFGICTPSFWVALLLVLVFSVWLGWLPSIGYVPPEQDFGRFLLHLAMPTAILGTEVAAQILRFVRTEFLEQLHQDYVRTARAKGLPERLVLWKHTLKNSLIATTTALGFQVANLLGGSTIIETVFAYPGIAYLMIQSIYNRDFAVVQGVVLFVALTVLLVNFLVDVCYAVLDPRIRLA